MLATGGISIALRSPMAHLFHSSPHQFEGSLADVSIPGLLRVCEDYGIEATIEVKHNDESGVIALRKGRIVAASYGSLTGSRAVDKMSELSGGMFTVRQKVSSTVSVSGARVADLFDVSIAAIMGFTEDNQLSCEICLSNERESVAVSYRSGQIASLAINGSYYEDTLANVESMLGARFRRAGLPTAIVIDGWPEGDDPTSEVEDATAVMLASDLEPTVRGGRAVREETQELAIGDIMMMPDEAEPVRPAPAAASPRKAEEPVRPSPAAMRMDTVEAGEPTAGSSMPRYDASLVPRMPARAEVLVMDEEEGREGKEPMSITAKLAASLRSLGRS